MGAQRTTFSKLQRDRAKKAKAALKRERRQERGASASAEPDVDIAAGEGELSASELLQLVEAIHRSYENKQISYEEYEEKKADLLSRLPVD